MNICTIEHNDRFLELSIPKDINCAIRKKIYRPINQLKEIKTNTIYSIPVWLTNNVAVVRYYYKNKIDKKNLIDTIEASLREQGQTIGTAKKKDLEKSSLSCSVKVYYSEGIAEKIAHLHIAVVIKNIEAKSDFITSTIAGMDLNCGTCSQVLTESVPNASEWNLLEAKVNKQLAAIKEDTNRARLELTKPHNKVYHF